MITVIILTVVVIIQPAEIAWRCAQAGARPSPAASSLNSNVNASTNEYT